TVNGNSLQVAVGLFSKGASGLTGHSTTSFATSVAAKQDPFTGGAIPDLSNYLNTNANLSALAISSGSLTPAFSGNTTSYTVSVTNATSTVTVTPTVDYNAASVKVNGVAVNSGSPSGNINLSVGSNTITVAVTAESGAVKTYTLTVTRALSSNN